MTMAECIRLAMDEWAGTPIFYGKSDCGLAIADIHNRFHGDGRDFASAWRGKYANKDGYMKLLGTRGVLRAAWYVARKNGWPRIEPGAASDGDIAIVFDVNDERCFAIRYQSRWLVRASYGFSALTDESVLRAWSCQQL